MIRTLRATFTATANGMRTTIRNVRDELSNLDQNTRRASNRMSRSFEDIGRSMQTSAGKLEKWSKSTKEFGSSLTKRVTAPAVAAATALGAITLVKGFDRLIGIDTAKAKLKGLGHDAEGVELIMNSALDSVRGTSFGMGEAATTAAGAVAAGVEPGKELTKYLKITGDAAAIAGASLGEMGSIVNKVQTSNTAYNDSLGQLSDRGLPIYQWIAKEAGVAEDAVFKMASEGKISSKMFLDAIENNIGGAASIIGAESFTAGMANMWAAVGRLGANFLDAGGKGGGFFSQLKPLIGEFTERIDEMGDMAVSAGVKFGKFFAGVIEKLRSLKKAYDGLSPAVQSFMSKVVLFGAVGAVAIGPLVLLFSSFLGIIAKILKPLGALFLWFSKVFRVIGSQGLGGALRSLTGRFTFLSRAFTILTGPIGIIIGVITLLIATSKTLRTALGNMITSLIEFGSKLYGQLKPAFDLVAKSLKAMMDSFKGTGKGFDSFGATLTPLVSMLGAFAKFVMGTFAVALGLIATVINGVARTIGPLINAAGNLIEILVNLGKAIVSVFTFDLKGMKKHFKAALQSVTDFFKNLWGAVVGLFTGFANALNSLIGDAVLKWVGSITKSFNKLREVSAVFDYVMSTIGKIIKVNIDYFKVLFSGWKAIFSGDFKTGAKILKDGIQNLFSSLLAIVKDWFTTMPGLITKTLSGWKSAIVKWFTDMKTEIPKRLNMWWTSIYAWMSSKYKAWSAVLGPWAKAITEWFAKMPSVISKSLSKWKTTIVNWFSEMRVSIPKKLNEWWTAISSWVSRKSNAWNTALSSWSNSIVEWFKRLPSLTSAAITNWWNAIKNGTAKGLDILIKVVSNGFSTIKKLINDKVNEWGPVLLKWFEDMKTEIPKRLNAWWTSISSWIISKGKSWGSSLKVWSKSIVEWFKLLPNLTVNALDNWWKSIENAVNKGMKTLTDSLSKGFSFTKKVFKDKLDEWNPILSGWFMRQKDVISKQLDAWGSVIAKWFKTMPGVITSTLKGWHKALKKWTEEQHKENVKAFSAWRDIIVKWFKSIPKVMMDHLSTWKSTIVNWFIETRVSIGNSLASWWATIREWFVSIPTKISMSLSNWWNVIASWFVKTKKSWGTGLGGWWTTISTWFTSIPKMLKEKLDNWWKVISDWFTNIGKKPEIKDAGVTIVTNMFDGVAEEKDNFMDKLGKTIVDVALAAIVLAGVALVAVGREIIRRIIQGISESKAFTGRASEWFVNDFVAGLKNKLTPVKDAGVTIVSALGKGIKNGLNNVTNFFAKISESVGGRFTSLIGEGMVGKIKSVVQGFFDSFKKSFESVGGVLSLAAPSLAGIGAAMLGLSGPVGLIVSVILSLFKVFKQLYEANEDFRVSFSGVGKEFSDAKDVIMDSVKDLMPTFVELGETFVDFGKTLFELFKEVAIAVAGIVKVVIPLVIGLVSELVKTVLPVLVDLFKALIGIVLELVKTVLPLVLDVIKSVFPMVLSVVKSVIPLVITIFTVLIDVVITLVKVILPLILVVVKMVFPIVLGIIKAILPIVVDLITTVINVVLMLVRIAIPLLLGMVKTVFPIISKIIDVAMKIVITVLKVVMSIIQKVLIPVIQTILKVVEFVFPIIAKVIELAMKVVVKVLEFVVKVIENVLVPAIEYILKIVQIVFPVITKVIKGALNVIIGIIDFFVALFTNNWSGMWDAIKKILSAATSIIWAVIKGAFDVIALYLKTVFNMIFSFMQMIWNKISGVFSSVIKWIVDFVKARFTILKDNVTTIFNAVKNFISTVWNGILAFFKFVIKAIVDYVKNYFTNLKNNITIIFNAIKDFASNVWNTIKDNIVNPITSAVKTAIDKFLEFKKKVTDTFKDIKDNVFGYVSDMIENVKAMPGKMKKGITDMAYKVFEGMKSIANKMQDGLKAGVNGVVTGVNWVMKKLNVDEEKHLDTWKPKALAHGTDSHEGGDAILGDGRGSNAGSELVRLPSGQMFLSADKDTLYPDLPKGTQVLSAKNTRKYLESVPAYNSGKGFLNNIMNKGKEVVGNAWSGTKNIGEKVVDAALDVWDYIKDPSGLFDKALSAIGISAPSDAGFIGDMAKGGFNKVKTGAVDFIKGKMDEFFTFEGGKGGSLGDSGGSRSISNKWGMHDYVHNIAQRIMSSPLGRGLVITSGYRSTSKTDHGKRNAVDLAGFGRNGGYKRVAQWASRLPGVSYAIGDNTVYGKKYGDGSRPSWATGHMNHLHVSGYEDGGIVTAKQLAWIAEGGWAESIISHDPAKRVSQRAIWERTGRELGFDKERGRSDNKELLGLLRRIAYAVESEQDLAIVMNDREVGRLVEPHVTAEQKRKNDRNRW